MNFPQRAFFTPRKSSVTGMSHKCHTNVTKCHKNVTQKSTDFWFIIRGVWGGCAPQYGMVWYFDFLKAFFLFSETMSHRMSQNFGKMSQNFGKMSQNFEKMSH